MGGAYEGPTACRLAEQCSAGVKAACSCDPEAGFTDTGTLEPPIPSPPIPPPLGPPATTAYNCNSRPPMS